MNDNVKVIDSSVVANFLTNYDTSGTYYFKPEATELLNLKQGDNTVFYGHSFGTVKSVTKINNQIIVKIDSGLIKDFIKNADVKWDYGFDFSSPKVTKLFWKNCFI